MKIGIVTHYYKSINYGGNLQAFALCKALEKLGYEAEQISLDRSKDISIKSRLKRCVKRILKPNLKNRSNFKIREKAFWGFNQNVIPHSHTIYSEKTIHKSADDYDAFITGSDQVWHPYAVCDAYLLKFAPSTKIKLSYAASIAHNILTTTQKHRYKKALADFNAISVRENEGKNLIGPLSPCRVEVTLDPTLLLSKDEWLEIADNYEQQDEYLFCYFLGDDIKQRELATEYAKKNNLKVVTLPHLLGKWRKCDKSFGDYKLYDVTPQRLLSLINNAKCIFTDSFHAMVFSSIFEKEYFVFQRSGAKAMSSRITTLACLLETQTHFCDSEDKMSLEYIEGVEKIDYSKESLAFLSMKDKSLHFLKNNISNSELKEQRAINVADNKNCSGCHACVSICPKKCIDMISDEEGFLYPLVNHDKCIKCGLCIKHCPIATPNESTKTIDDIQAFGAYNKDESVRNNSSSGGIFTALAETIIENEGVVFGAAFNDDFSVSHKEAFTKDELVKFRGSKYVQSEIGDSYKKAKNYLEQGKIVLFSGTPCQIGGLYSYLGKKYDNLITQDIICHGVPSPMVWKKYIKQREEEAKQQTRSVLFKDKKTGWKTYSITLKFNNGKQYTQKATSDLMMKAFIGNLCLRPSCYGCSFKELIRQSDITLADYWGINKISPQMDDDKGLSLVIVNSNKGKNILQRIESKIVKFDASLETAVLYNSSMIKSSIMPHNRASFMTKIKDGDFDKVAKAHLKPSLIKRIKSLIKRIIKKIIGRK